MISNQTVIFPSDENDKALLTDQLTIHSVANKKLNVVQDNHLINAHFSMTQLEMKIYVTGLVHICKEDKEFKTIEINVRSLFPGKADLSGSYYENIKNSCEELSEKTLKVVSSSRNGKGQLTYTNIPFFSLVQYDSGCGRIILEFNKRMKPYLLGLTGNFTMASLSDLYKLSSYYSCRIYLLLKEVKAFGNRVLLLEDLKSMLDISSLYPRYTDFKTRVLEKVKQDLSCTDMAFVYKEKRKGRRVEAIQFVIQCKDTCLEIEPSTRAVLLPEKKSVLTEDQQRALTILEKNYDFSSYQNHKIISTLPAKTIFKINVLIIQEKSSVTSSDFTGFAYNRFQKAFPC